MGGVKNVEAVACCFCGSERFEALPDGRPSATGWPRRCARCRSLGHDRILHRLLLALPSEEFEERRILILGGVPFRADDRFATAVRLGTGRPMADLAARIDRLPGERWDWILCHHVLQFVVDDRELHAGLYRRLSGDGLLLQTVPGTATGKSTAAIAGVQRGAAVVHRVYGRDAPVHLAGGDCRMLYDELRRIDLPTAEEESVFLWSKSPERLAQMRFYLAAPPLPICNLCGGASFEPGPRGRLSHRRLPPRCVACGALERDRIVATVWKAFAESYRARLRVLHCSDDCGISRGWFASYERRLYGRRRDRLDLERIGRADGSYDAVICNYVLGRVPDDRQAFRELLRVLSPHGFVQFMVPGPGGTAETRELREASEEAFGNYRTYGRDLVERFTAVAPRTGWLMLRQRDPATASDDLVFLWAKQAEVIDTLARFVRSASIPIVARSTAAGQAG